MRDSTVISKNSSEKPDGQEGKLLTKPYLYIKMMDEAFYDNDEIHFSVENLQIHEIFI